MAWADYLPFVRCPQADFLTLLLFLFLGPSSGMLLLGFKVAGLNGALSLPFWFAFGMGTMPKTATAMLVLMGALPAYAAGLTALAVRSLDRFWVFLLAAIIGGCGMQLWLLSSVDFTHRTDLVIAAAGAAAICAGTTYRARLLARPRRGS